MANPRATQKQPQQNNHNTGKVGGKSKGGKHVLYYIHYYIHTDPVQILSLNSFHYITGIKTTAISCIIGFIFYSYRSGSKYIEPQFVT